MLPTGVVTLGDSLVVVSPVALTQPKSTIIPPISPTEDTNPVPSPTGSTDRSLDDWVAVSIRDDLLDYDRRQWRHWVDAGGDCQNARQEVLVEESLGPIIFTDTEQCQVASGQWMAPSTGAVVADPTKLDIDYLLPLANAHRLGGHAWDTNCRRAYANDLNNPAHLVAVTASANRAKGAGAGKLAAAGLSLLVPIWEVLGGGKSRVGVDSYSGGV